MPGVLRSFAIDTFFAHLVHTATMVVMVMGLPGSGKSYFALRLAKALHAVYISSDQIRYTIPSKGGTYSIKSKLSVYNEMLVKMKQALNNKKDVVLDATFYKISIRKKFIDETRNSAVVLFIIEVKANEWLIRERLKQTRKNSEADFEVFKTIEAQWEPFEDDHLILQSTSNNINDMLQTAIDYLKK